MVEPAGPSPPPVPAIKGAAFRGFLLWYETDWNGRGKLQNVAAGLPPALRALVFPDRPALGLLASSWYPSALCAAVLDGVCGGLTTAERTELVQVGTRAVAATMLRGLYKVLFEMIATPSLYARHIGRAWRQLHSTGDRHLVITEPGRAESTIESWPGHHPVLCEIATETMVVLFERMGRRDVHATRVSCVAHGSPICRAHLRWEP